MTDERSSGFSELKSRCFDVKKKTEELLDFIKVK